MPWHPKAGNATLIVLGRLKTVYELSSYLSSHLSAVGARDWAVWKSTVAVLAGSPRLSNKPNDCWGRKVTLKQNFHCLYAPSAVCHHRLVLYWLNFISGTRFRFFPSFYCLQYNFIAKCQYTDCTRNVLWCQVHSSHIHSNHKTFNSNSKNKTK